MNNNKRLKWWQGLLILLIFLLVMWLPSILKEGSIICSGDIQDCLNP